MRRFTLLMFVVIALVIFAGLSIYMYYDLMEPAKTVVCTGDKFSQQFADCGRDAYHRLFKTGYTEGKDLGKSLLTLLSAVFVASITFSEKIVDLKSASKWPRIAMIVCWLLLLLSIGTCGAAFVYISWVQFRVVRFGELAFHQMNHALVLFGVAGFCFGLGLLTMLLAALPSILVARRAD